MWQAPRQLWKTHTLKKTLRQANDQRRQALKVLRVLRPTASVPEVRARILELTESLLVNDERLKHSIQSLHQTDQSVSAGISQALRLAPQLRAWGERPITMEQPVDPVLVSALFVGRERENDVAIGNNAFLLEPQLYTPHLVYTLEGRWQKSSLDEAVNDVE